MASAADRTFGVVEIFEEILSYLRHRDLSHCHSVSRTWRFLVTTSAVVDVFLAQTAPGKGWISQLKPCSMGRSNHRVVSIIPKGEAAVLQEAQAIEGEEYRRDRRIMPIRQKVAILARPNLAVLEFTDTWQDNEVNLRAAHGESMVLALRNGRPIFTAMEWQRKVFLTQPPVKEISLAIWTRRPPLIGTRLIQGMDSFMKAERYLTMSVEEGIRWGDLCEFLEAAEELAPLAKIDVDLHGVVFAADADWAEVERQVEECREECIVHRRR